MHTIEKLLDSVSARDDAPVLQVVVGLFVTVVVLDTRPRRCGVATTLRAPSQSGCVPLLEVEQLTECTGLELAGWLRSSSRLNASVGMAALNALLWSERALGVPLNAEQLLLTQGDGRRVAIVGRLPFTKRVQQVACQCQALDLDERCLALAPRALPEADVVAISGITLTNHTFDTLVGLCRPDAYVTLVGPSAPLCPILLDQGLDAVAGTRVVDVDAVVSAVSRGANLRQVTGRQSMTVTRASLC
jgi:uncharacterized protein